MHYISILESAFEMELKLSILSVNLLFEINSDLSGSLVVLMEDKE